MNRPTTPDSHVVRRMGSGKTHVMLVREVIAGSFIKPYWIPVGELAACGVNISDGVVMKPGTTTRCGACRHVTGITEEGPW